MGLNRKINIFAKSRYFVAAFVMVISVITPFFASPSANAQTSAVMSLGGDRRIQEVQTGLGTACVVADGWVYCWGANDLGQLGNGKISTAAQATPVAVSNVKTAVPAKTVCTSSFAGFCLASTTTPEVKASAMAGLEVERVSVGFTHACAVASAKVYCWGDNSHGQLGNKTTTTSSVPVKVDISGIFSSKEIIDVTAGELFSCALASDGTVACWGSGEQGRLGTGNENDVEYPVAIDTEAGSPLVGKKVIKLARASLSTMCVLAVSEADFRNGAANGNPYCWGVGIGNGTIPSAGRVTVPCSKTSPTSVPTGAGSITTIFTSSTPVQISSTQVFSQIDGVNYVTGLADNKRPYYWGMHGYREDNKYINYTTCSVNPCTANTTSKIKLAVSVKNSAGDKAKKKAQDNAKKSNTGGGDKNKNLNSNTTAMQSAQNAANGGNYTSFSGNYVSSSSYGFYTGAYTAQTGGTSYNATIQGNGNGGVSFNINNFAGVARPNGATTQGANVGNNKKNNSNCGNVTHYGYTADRTVTEIGKTSPTVPHASSLNQTNLGVFAGNVEAGLFCATKASGGLYCDANQTSVTEGQTGSNYTEQCTTTGALFWQTTTCLPPPTGPQQVVATGFLNGKTVKQLSTGLSGYTCALANNSVGCWGRNNIGQLGTGDTVNKLVPTALKLQ